MKKLKRCVQCDKCPWKKSTDPNEIPDGYDVAKHESLVKTIAQDLSWDNPYVMSCHEHNADERVYCVGYLHNQLGKGNNISLRISMREYDLRDMKIVGEQHETFEDTLPSE